MFAQKVKIKLYDNQDCTGETIGTIELSYFESNKALSMLEDVIRPVYNEMGMPCSFKIEIIDYDL
jgi:hypothetical protein